MQMLLYTQRVNDAREARGVLAGQLVLAQRQRPRCQPADAAATPAVVDAPARAAAARRLGRLGRGLARARRRPDRRACWPATPRRRR